MKVHLISMPAATPHYTPIQIGCLKAYVDQKFSKKVGFKSLSYSTIRYLNVNADFMKEAL
jgi:hypothetical protein